MFRLLRVAPTSHGSPTDECLNSRRARRSARGHAGRRIFAALAIVLAGRSRPAAPAEDLQEKLDDKEAALDSGAGQEGRADERDRRLNDQIDVLTGQVAALRNREADVQAELDEAQAELEDRAAATWGSCASGSPARSRAASSGWSRSTSRTSPTRSPSCSRPTASTTSCGATSTCSGSRPRTPSIVGRVRDLRDEAKAETVDRDHATTATRSPPRSDELARTRVQLEAREAELDRRAPGAASARCASDRTSSSLEGDIDELEEEIQEQLAAARQRRAASPALPAARSRRAPAG